MTTKETSRDKFCRDCHFSRNKYVSESEWRCRSPKNVALHPTNLTPMKSIITGEAIPQFDTCSAARSHNATGCGYDAVWFMTTQDYLRSIGNIISPPRVVTSHGKRVGVEDI